MDFRTIPASAFDVTFQRRPDNDADISHLQNTAGNYDGCTPEEVAAYTAQDAKRLADYYADRWHMVGVVCYVRRAGIILAQTSLWGIESDSDEAYFKETEASLAIDALEVARDALACLFQGLVR